MSFYPVPPVSASVAGDGVGGLGSMVVAVPLSALRWPVREGLSGDGRSALVVVDAPAVRTGEVVVWLKVMLLAPAAVRRDGRVQVAGKPADHARLGVLEEELDARCGPGTIEQVAGGVCLGGGKVKGVLPREMCVAFTLRAVLLMTLMPQVGTREVMSTLLGDLLLLPWQRARVTPTSKVFSRWRAAVGPGPVQQLRDLVLGASVAEHRDQRPGIDVGGRLRVGAIDGSVTRMPDTKTNREEFGVAGASDTGYPQIRHLHISDAWTRATLGVVSGPAGGDKAEAEQALLDRALKEYPQVFTSDRLWLMDRNFPGVKRIQAVLEAGSHVLIRVKSDIRLLQTGATKTDGSYLATVSGGGITLTVRVIEYHILLAGALTEELFCLITDLIDHVKHPAHLLAAAYRRRWDGSETALREAKSTLHGAGPGTGAIFRSKSPALINQEHAAWTCATELVHALTRTATTIAATFTKGPRTGHLVHARDLSFTTARHTAIASITTTTALAHLSPTARTRAHHTILATIAGTRNTVDRNRHRERKIKSRQPFSHAPRDITTTIAPAVIHVCGANPPATATITDLRPPTPHQTPPTKITEYAA